MGVDKMAATAFGLMLIPLAAYIIDFILQFKGITEGAERINVLNIRVAAFLPWYAFFMMIAVAAPAALPALNIPLSMVESYSFYCFFALLVTNAGGPAGMVNTMNATSRSIMCCNPCCPKDHEGMYNGATRGIWHVLVTRNIITVIGAICSYSGTRIGKVLYALLTACCTILLINGLMRIFLIYELIYASAANVFNVWKVMLLKFSIGLIVAEGLIAEFMISFDAEPYDDDGTFDKEDKTYRAYCSLVLIEFAILSIPYVILWAMKVRPPPAASTEDKAAVTAPLTFAEYACRVMTFWDVLGTLVPTELNKPLQDGNKV